MDDEPDDLTVDVSADGDVALLRIAGEIDTSTVDMISDAAQKAVQAGADTLILDMSAVTFMDSSGIGAIIALQANAMVRMRKPSQIVERLIATTGLTEVFEVEP